ncbi:MAG: YIP1 family protein [Vicinamibacterales bacterium]
MASLQNRIIGAMTLQVSTFEEVEHDTTAMGQAALIVTLAAVSSGISWILWSGPGGIIRGAISALIGWVIGAVVVWAIGTKLLPGPKTQADIGQVMRTVGFAQAPGLLSFVAIIPILGVFISLVIWVWTLIAWVIAVRSALDYENDTMRAVIVCVLAFVAIFIVTAVVGLMFGAGALMSGALRS